MIIKKYQAKTEAEAVELAKKELGQGVVIMNVRNVKKKGIFSIFRSRQVELTVALEDEEERGMQRRETKQPQTFQMPVNMELPEKKQPIIPRELVESTIEQPEKEDASGKEIAERLDSLQNLLEKQLKPAETEPAETEEPEKKSETEAFIQLLYNTMIENEVDEKYANQILDELEKNSKANMPMDYTLANVYQKLILKFGMPVEIEPAEAGAKVVFFIGPTGVGKTTTIAKLASKFKLDEKKKIALLTADTYRIAAVEQLRVYANILEVPFRVVYSPEEIEQALQQFADYDYILIDTAGHSHHNACQKDAMKELIHSVDGKAEKDVYLVISATTKYRDLISIADAYQDMVDYKLIFTKLDETTTYGNLLNLRLYTDAPLSYVTCGQNVPDDIEKFNPQKTVKKLLGGRR